MAHGQFKEAILSDVHGNWEALQAVLTDVDRHEPDRIVCLGDTVGYGPDSARCFDFLRRRSAIILAGNHEWGLQTGDATEFHGVAADALDVARAQLESRGSERTIEKRLADLDQIESSHEEGDVLYVHGSPLDPVWDYVIPSYIEEEWDREHLRRVFAKIRRVCFCGHSHFPCVITDEFDCWWPEDDTFTQELDPARRYLINVGSVGQPRDGDPRACYVLHADDRVLFRRVPYAIETTQGKIERTDGLSDCLARRLETGD